MAAKRRHSRGRDDSPNELAAALAPHVDELVAAAARREAEAEARERAERERPRRLDEAELMTLIFEHLDDDNPRVCVGIDFDRLVLFVAGLDGGRSAALPPSSEARRGPPSSQALRALEPPSIPIEARLAEHVWSGRGWTDEIQAIDPDVLDRPELAAEARSLLGRASGRVLATVNLRRLEREPAIAHLELFVQACRQQRARYVRVITGKGIESRAEPVIKRAVLHWCRERALGCAPELDVHGEWGALIIELGRGSHA